MNKAIIFDMDGVIFDTEKLFWEVWLKLAEEYGLEQIEEVLTKCLGINIVESERIFLTTYGNKVDYHHLRKQAEESFRTLLKTEGMPVKKGVKELLDYLTKEDYKLAVASSTKVELVKEELQQAGLKHYFKEIVGGDMVKHSKPHPQIYLTACERLQVIPRETMAIEDSFNGVRSAYAAGLRTIMVPDIMQPDETIRAMLFKECQSLLEVKEFLCNCTCN